VMKKAVTKGAIAEPLLPKTFIASAVAIADAKEFKKFVPISTVVKSRSIFDFNFAITAAFFLRSSIMLRNFNFGSKRYAVSEDVKKPTHSRRKNSSNNV
jgi:hypothetical protein